MDLTLYCAVPFYSNNADQRHQIIVSNAADIVDSLLRAESRTNKTKPALPDLTYRRRRPSNARSSRRSTRRKQVELSPGRMPTMAEYKKAYQRAVD